MQRPLPRIPVPSPCCFPSPGLSRKQQPPHHLEGPLPATTGQNCLHPVVKNGCGQARQDKAGPWALPAVMMSDRADTEADLGTRPPLGEGRVSLAPEAAAPASIQGPWRGVSRTGAVAS